MPRRIVEHKDFSGGDWGRRQPWNAAPNSFKALNMLVYSTGEIGVRPGLLNITPTNVQAGSIATGMMGDLTSSYLYGQGTVLRRATSYKNQTQATPAGTFTGAVTTLYFVRQGLSISGNAVYVMDPSRGIYSLITNTLTQLTALAGNGLAFYGDRLCFGSLTGTTSNLRYNGLTAGVSDLTSWPATNIIPYGDKNERPSTMFTQRGHLTMLKATNGLFIITGQLGVSETLRRAVNTLGPVDGTPLTSANTETELIWFVNTNHHIPANFDGTQVRYYEDQILPLQGDGSISLAAIPISDPDGVAISIGTSSSNLPFADTAKLHLFHHGVWTRHELPNLGQAAQITSTVNASLYDPGITQTLALIPENFPYLSHDVPALIFANNSGATPAFYSMLLDTDRPGYDWGTPSSDFITYNAESPGDDSLAQVSGTLELPEVHLKDADEFMVQGVIVDFRSWNTKGSLSNHYDVQVDCLRPYDNTSPISSLKASWDQVGSLSATGGTVRRETFMFGEQGIGNGYQIKLSNIRGVAIQRIQVILDTMKVRGI